MQGLIHSLFLQNLLFSGISEDAALKVVDFGFARLLSDESKMLTTPCYTLTYAAPEVLSTRHNGGYTEACDLWSIGVILVSSWREWFGLPPLLRCMYDYSDLDLRPCFDVLMIFLIVIQGILSSMLASASPTFANIF